MEEIEQTALAQDITTFQLKAARNALNFRLQDVTSMTGVAGSTILRIEAKDPFTYPKRTSIQTVMKLKSFYESYGAIFYKNGALGLQELHKVLASMDEAHTIDIFEHMSPPSSNT
jgi:transcriptional regulator with XRE-family HTH domain